MTARQWVYKVNASHRESSVLADRRANGDWSDLFDDGGEMAFGGTWATGDPRSLGYLRGEMRVGDLVFCYQTDRTAIVGIARITRLERDPVDGEAVELFLEPDRRFRRAVPVLRLKRSNPALASVRAFQHNSLGMLHPLTDEDAAVLHQACSDHAAKQPARRRRRSKAR